MKRVRVVLVLLSMVCAFAVQNCTYSKRVASPVMELEDVFILSDIDAGRIEVRLWFKNGERQIPADLSVRASILDPFGESIHVEDIPVQNPEKGDYRYFTVDIDPVYTWEPANPRLYHIDMTFLKGDRRLAAASRRFGMRKFESRGGRFFVNNNPFFIRFCAGEGGCGSDDLDRMGVLKRLTEAKRYGFNAVRHHSHVPTETYLEVADEVGLLIQMEIHGKVGNDPQSDRFRDSTRDWIRMIERGRTHPCTFVYGVGNEIYKNDPGLIESQDILYDLAKEMDPSVLVLNRSGSNPLNDAFGKFDLIERPIGEYEHVAEFAREAFELYLRGDRKGRCDEFPIIAHEYPLVASYPNVELSYKYDEEPSWIATTRENARKYDLEHLFPEYVKYSEKIQNLCRKEMLEEARKFPELDGYSMLRFVDCGSRISGVVDDFADPKSVTAEEFLRTNGDTVLLCSWNKRSFRFGETLEAKIEISHHGPEPYTAPKCRWWLMNGPKVIDRGKFKGASVDPVKVSEIGTIRLAIPNMKKACKLTLRADLPDTRPYINNEWYFWAFPNEKVEDELQSKMVIWDPRNRLKTYLDQYPGIEYSNDKTWKPSEGENRVVITDSWQEEFYAFLDRGGRLFMISDKSWPWPEEIGIFGLHITKFIPEHQAPPVFPELNEHCAKWLTVCSNTKVRYGNSGTIIYPHPLMDSFPHEGFCDLQFFPMIYRAKSLQLEYFPTGTQPIIRTIDNYHRGQSKGYMAELRVGEGRVFVSTLNLTQSFPRATATRYMFDRILRYLNSSDFDPEIVVSKEELRDMIEDFAKILKERKPLIHDEMPARYSTRWKWLLSPYELIPLHSYQAEGLDQERLDVHFEYAQTQWYYKARPGDELSWKFMNKTEGDFKGVLYLAGPLKNLDLSLRIDEQASQTVRYPGSDSWEHFIPVEFTVKDLKEGGHKLTLTLSPDLPEKEGATVNIRDIELTGTERP